MGEPDMVGILLILCLSSSFLLFGPGLIAAVVAWRKEYPPWFWLLSFGPVGTLLILLRPSLNQAATPEQREKWEQQANWTGGVLSGFTFFFIMLALPAIGLVGYFTVSLPMAAPVVRTATATATDEMVPLTSPEASENQVEPERPSNGGEVPSDAADAQSPMNQLTDTNRSP